MNHPQKDYVIDDRLQGMPNAPGVNEDDDFDDLEKMVAERFGTNAPPPVALPQNLTSNNRGPRTQSGFLSPVVELSEFPRFTVCRAANLTWLVPPGIITDLNILNVRFISKVFAHP